MRKSSSIYKPSGTGFRANGVGGVHQTCLGSKGRARKSEGASVVSFLAQPIPRLASCDGTCPVIARSHGSYKQHFDVHTFGLNRFKADLKPCFIEPRLVVSSECPGPQAVRPY